MIREFTSDLTSDLSRRDFLKRSGIIAVAFSISPSQSLFASAPHPPSLIPLPPNQLDSWLVVAADGSITVFCGKVELGTGVSTALRQIVAEELDAPIDRITWVQGDSDRTVDQGSTVGSQSVKRGGAQLRRAAAEARAVLLKLAAGKLGVAGPELTVDSGVVSVAGDPSRKVTYGELAKGKKISRLVDEKAVLRSVARFQVMGTSPRRLDGREKVTGAAQYAGDVRLPGLVYARLLRPLAHGATLVKVDTAAALRLAGVQVVKLDDLVAVLHADPEAAAAALAAVKAEWSPKPLDLDPESIFDHLEKSATAGGDGDRRGDVAAARAAAAPLFEATYRKGYVAHAPLEPHTAVAEPKDGRVTVWASTQTPFPLRDQIAKALQLDPSKVRVITPYLGGGFGGKSAGRQAIEAARLAVAAGRPVQVAWTRAEEFFYDTFDPAAVVKVASAVDAQGKITLWDYAVYAAGPRGATLFYDVPNARVRALGDTAYGPQAGFGLHPFGTGPWRAPGARMNVFAVESQIDAMAAHAGLDPLEFRLRNTSDARMRRVLEAAAQAFGWKSAKAPAGLGTGRGRGLACGIDAGTYAALMVEIAVDAATGAIRVLRVVAAQDMGIVVNPDGARMQTEGCITMGLGYVLSEEVNFRGGELLTQGFDTYELPRFSALPKIETVLVKNDELDPQGAGEPAIVPLGGAVANALFDAIGRRLYRLPLTPERVKAALAATPAAA